MASLADAIISANEKGKGLKAGNWRTEVRGGDVCYLYHYSTCMLSWYRDHGRAEGPQVIDYWLGRGSKSDQDGMNKAFRILGMSLYYSRKGGAKIVEREVW